MLLALVVVILNSDRHQYFNVIMHDVFLITPSLLNGLFMIHPALIGLLFWLIMCTTRNKLVLYTRCTLSCKLLTHSCRKPLYVALTIAVTAMFLGGWWAYQELGWGGWWSWDAVELVNLIILLCILTYIHAPQFIVQTRLGCYLTIFMIFTIFHLSTRWDLFNSIHSFSTSSVTIYSLIATYTLILLLAPNQTQPQAYSVLRIDFMCLLYLVVLMTVSSIWELIITPSVTKFVWWVVLTIISSDISLYLMQYSTISWLFLFNPYLYLMGGLWSYFKFKTKSSVVLHCLLGSLFLLSLFNGTLVLSAGINWLDGMVYQYADIVSSYDGLSNNILFNQIALAANSFNTSTVVYYYYFIVKHPAIFVFETTLCDVLNHNYSLYFIIPIVVWWNFKNIIMLVHTKYKKWCTI